MSLLRDSTFVKTQQLDRILSSVSKIIAAAIASSNIVQTDYVANPIVPASAKSMHTVVVPTTIASTSIPTVPTIVTASLTETEI